MVAKRKRAPVARRTVVRLGVGGGMAQRSSRAIIVPGITRTQGSYATFAKGEVKWFDTTAELNAEQGPNTLHSLNLIPQGVKENERIGRKCTITSIHFKGYINMAGASDFNFTDEAIRLMIVVDSQTNGSTVASNVVLEGTSYLAFKNMENGNRFRVLYDKTIAVNCSAGSYDGTTDKFAATGTMFSFYKNLSVPIFWNAASEDGSLATIRSNNISFFLLGKTGSICTVRYNCRVRYKDS